MEQKVKIKGGAKISTNLEFFSLICNSLHIKKTRMVYYFCPTKNCRKNENKLVQCAFLHQMENPRNFDPFGQNSIAHLAHLLL